MDALPEEFHALKKQLKNSIKMTSEDFSSKLSDMEENVRLTKEERKFVKWGTTKTNKEAKDLEKSNGTNNNG